MIRENRSSVETFSELPEPRTKEEVLAFLQNPSERNKQKAFLVYYGEERNETEQTILQR